MNTLRKAAAEALVIEFDWMRNTIHRLWEGETISNSAWTIASGITGTLDTFDSTTTQIKITGGTLDSNYLVKNEISTSKGNVWDQSIKVQIVTR